MAQPTPAEIRLQMSKIKTIPRGMEDPPVALDNDAGQFTPSLTTAIMTLPADWRA